MEAGDANAFYVLGTKYHEGSYGLPKDPKNASELYSRAAELGSAGGHCSIGNIYSAEKSKERDFFAVNQYCRHAVQCAIQLSMQRPTS